MYKVEKFFTSFDDAETDIQNAIAQLTEEGNVRIVSVVFLPSVRFSDVDDAKIIIITETMDEGG